MRSSSGGATWFWHLQTSGFHETFTRSSLALNMSRKLVSDPYLAIHGKIMAKTAIFSWNFDLFLTFFMDCGHIYVPKRKTWGSTSSPHIGDVMMSLFFTLGSTVHDWGWPKNGPFWTKNGQTWQACQRSKVVQRGPKGTKMVNLSLFEHLGPFWAHLDPFGPFQTRIDILLRSTSAKPYFVHLGQKNNFCLKWSKRVQMGQIWFQMEKKI